MGTSYQIKKLAEKYEGFAQPNLCVLLDGTQLKTGAGIYLNKADIHLSNRTEPNLAVLGYTVRRTGDSAVSRMEKLVKLGGRVEVKLGYRQEMSRVFLGYVHEASVSASGGDSVVYELVCLDVKALMKINSLYGMPVQKKASQFLNIIFNTAAYGNFIEKKEIGAIEDAVNLNYAVTGETHFEWAARLAVLLNYEFYMSDGTLCFQKARKDSSSLIELNGEMGVIAQRSSVTMSGQTAETEVAGGRPGMERLSAVRKRKSAGGPFEQNMSKVLSGSRRRYIDDGLLTQQQAKYRAEALGETADCHYSGMELVTVGLPELAPGRFITVSNGLASLSGKIYVEEVVHSYGKDGYITTVKGYR